MERFYSNMTTSLPEDCISRILSLTSPQDACRMLLVSREFRVPAESNVVWDRFLPTDCCHITSSCSLPLKFSSKKQLFFLLSNSILIDGGSKTFALEKSSGRISYILSARELSILHSDVDSKWTWKSIQESRFAEVAELITVDRLEIEGRIRSQKLSQNTKYGAYLLFKICEHSFGLGSIPGEISIASGDRILLTNTACLRDPDYKRLEHLEDLFYRNRVQMMQGRINKGEVRAARKRGDGWLEMEVGEFFVSDDDDEEIVMSLKNVKGYQLKGGLLVQGIEVRPKG